MFWKFLIVVAIALAIFHLGALSVRVAVLQVMLAVVVAALLGPALMLVWRLFKR